MDKYGKIYKGRGAEEEEDSVNTESKLIKWTKCIKIAIAFC